jgi:two-component system, sensor histidine kinase and response regulator
MKVIGSIDERRLFLATALASRGQKQAALIIAAVAATGFIIAVPFARVPLIKLPGFIPSYEAALFFIDLITALLLFEQFVRLRLISILVLASGYLFDAFLIVPHALSFPGAFAPTGLLGAKEQTTAWLYVFWHGGFPLFVIAYALIRWRTRSGPKLLVSHPYKAMFVAIVAVAALAVGLAALTTVGHDFLPVVMQGSDYSLLVKKGVSPAVWLLTLAAMLLLWQRPLRIVDLWLMLVMWIWLFDIALAAVIGSSRFDLGFYVGRIFGLIAASFLLIMLLGEMGRLYIGALGAAADAEQRFAELARERAQRPIPIEREKPENFVVRQNISHYRDLLATGRMDEKQRRSIERLLMEEEARLSEAAEQQPGPERKTPG